jgi:hypothetical protein
VVRLPDEDGRRRRREEVREFKTTVRELLGLRDWLAGFGVTHVAMEATGVYWRPVWAVLEDDFELYKPPTPNPAAEQRQRERTTKRLIGQLEKLGHSVTLHTSTATSTSTAPAAAAP